MGNSDENQSIKKKVLVPASIVPGMLFYQKAFDDLKPTLEYANKLNSYYHERLASILNLKEVEIEDDSPQPNIDLPKSSPGISVSDIVTVKKLSKKEMIEIVETYGLTEKEMVLFKELVNNADKFIPTKYLAIKVGVSGVGLRQLKLKINRKLRCLGVKINSDQKALGQAGRYSISLLTR